MVLASCLIKNSSADSANLPSVAQLVATTPELEKLLHTLLAHEEFWRPLSNYRAGLYTVLAPTNTSFENAEDIRQGADIIDEVNDKGEGIRGHLSYALGFHMLEENVLVSDIMDGDKFPMVIGESIMAHVNDDKMGWIKPAARESGAKVFENDILACNGVVHIVNSVLTPLLPEEDMTEVSEDAEVNEYAEVEESAEVEEVG